MGSSQPAEYAPEAFAFSEYLDGQILKTYSCGNGRFFTEAPTIGLRISFDLTKTAAALDITIYDDSLIQWLRTISSLRGCLDRSRKPRAYSCQGGFPSVSMDILLPCYPEVKAKFAETQSQEHSSVALDLFVRHFLREGSVFVTFGLEHLLEKQILTEVHFRDIQSEHSSMSEDLDRIDEIINELNELGELSELREPVQPDVLDERCDKGPSQFVLFMGNPFRSHLRAAIGERDLTTVAEVLAIAPGHIDAGTLCHAIRSHERTIFHRLLEHGAQVDSDNRYNEPLYRAAKAGHMDAVRQLLNCGANIEGGCSSVSVTTLTGAASGGHLEIVRYLVEHGANINGNSYRSPLGRAFKHHHPHIIDFLLSAGADPAGPAREVLSRIMGTHQQLYCEKLARLIARMPDHTRQLPISRAAMVRYLLASTTYANPTHAETPLYHYTPKIISSFCCMDSYCSHGCRPPKYSTGPEPGMMLPFFPECRPTENGHPIHFRCQHVRFQDICCPHEQVAYVSTSFFSMVVFYAVQKEHPEYELGLFLALLDQLRSLLDGFGNLDSNVLLQAIWTGLKIAYDHPMHGKSEGITKCLSASWTLLEAELRKMFNPDGEAGHSQVIATNLARERANLAHERRIMARRLLAKVGRSHGRLLVAGASKYASAGLMAFVGQLGNRSSTWRSGARAIRNIAEGYMPSGLPDVISALRVADAMRSAVSHSGLVCSKREFVDDIPRWASLLSLDEQPLFFEISSHLWNIPVIPNDEEGARTFDREEALIMLQFLVKNLVSTSGLFEDGPGSFGTSFRLQSLRQRHSSAINHRTAGEARVPLDLWHPSPTPEVSGNLHSDDPKPPDPEEKHLGILARITILVAGAIFGAILLYLCQSRCGLSSLSLLIPSSDSRQGFASDQILTRNFVILSMYLGRTSGIDSESERSHGHLEPEPDPTSPVFPGNSPINISGERLATFESPYEGDLACFEWIGPGDAIMEDVPVDSSPSLPSHPTTLPSAAAISPSVATATPSSTITTPSGDGTIHCEYCKSEFKLGKNGRRGQASNLQKHKRNHHPETIPGYHRVLHRCRWGCGATDPNRSNIEVHMRQHCAKRKGKQPRRHGKWHESGDITSTASTRAYFITQE